MEDQLGILESLGLRKKPAAAPSGKTIKVGPGDTLKKIAKREYGDASKWHDIYEANKDTIKNPDLIYPGQTFKIPNA